MPSAAGWSERRSGAGDESWADCRGRSKKRRVSELCAARWRRLRLSFLQWLAQNKTHPVLFDLRICSVAQSASAVFCGCTQVSCEGGIPSAANAIAWGGWGGCTSMIPRLATAAMAGAKSRSSPLPAWPIISSVSSPTGQPPPGSWLASTGCPQSMQRELPRASWEARQIEGWSSSSAVLLSCGMV